MEADLGQANRENNLVQYVQAHRAKGSIISHFTMSDDTNEHPQGRRRIWMVAGHHEYYTRRMHQESTATEMAHMLERMRAMAVHINQNVRYGLPLKDFILANDHAEVIAARNAVLQDLGNKERTICIDEAEDEPDGDVHPPAEKRARLPGDRWHRIHEAWWTSRVDITGPLGPWRIPTPATADKESYSDCPFYRALTIRMKDVINFLDRAAPLDDCGEEIVLNLCALCAHNAVSCKLPEPHVWDHHPMLSGRRI